MDYNEAVNEVLKADELFRYSTSNIRGNELKTFKNTPQTLVELLDYGFSTRQWEDFLVYEDERLTYSDFIYKVRTLAQYMKSELGVKKGDKIAVAMRNYPEYSILFMAIVSLGAVIVFVNGWWTSEEMEYGFDDSQSKLCFADEERLKVISPFAQEKDIKLISVRSNMPEEIQSFENILLNSSGETFSDAKIDPDDDFGVMYTSGSTGHPKGVVLTHRGAISATFSWLMAEKVGALLDNKRTNARKPSSVLLLSPLFHVNGTHPNFLYSIAKGSKLVCMYKWDPKKAIDIIENEAITRIAAVPTVVTDLVNEALSQGNSLDSLESLNAGGAKRPPPRVAIEKKALPHTDITSGYGMTETNALGLGVAGEEYLDNPELAGRLYAPLQELRIVDESGEEVQDGVIGEIALKSAANMRCYLNKEEATREVLKNGWMHTGDLAYINEAGLIVIVDRKKNIIIRGGENISCLEVEGIIQNHPEVVESIVFSVPDERFGEEVGVCIHINSNSKMDKGSLTTFLNGKVAKFKIPSYVWFMSETLPRGATDKLDRIVTRDICLKKLN